MLKNKFVYIYTFPNGKKYVGQSNHNASRYSNAYKYKGLLVYKAMKKYRSYHCEIVADDLSFDEANKIEKEFIKKLKSDNRKYGYNLTSGGQLNKTFSPNARKNISKGLKRYYSTHDGMRKGVKLSEEIKRKISKSHIGIKQTEESKAKISLHSESKTRVIVDGFLMFDSVKECADFLKSKTDDC